MPQEMFFFTLLWWPLDVQFMWKSLVKDLTETASHETVSKSKVITQRKRFFHLFIQETFSRITKTLRVTVSCLVNSYQEQTNVLHVHWTSYKFNELLKVLHSINCLNLPLVLRQTLISSFNYLPNLVGNNYQGHHHKTVLNKILCKLAGLRCLYRL